MLASGLLMVAAAGDAVYHNLYRMAVIFMCYAVANFMLAGAK